MSVGETIGQRLRRLRLEKGMSQRDLAGPGVSYAYISRIEGGQRQPSLRAIRVLARKLGLSAQYLETGSTTTSEEDREIRLSDAELRLRLGESVDEAEDALRDVLREAREAGDRDAAIFLDRPEQAADLYERCLDELAKAETTDASARVRFATHLSYALSNQGRFAEAREVLADLTASAGTILDPYARIRLFWSLARLAIMEGQAQPALRHLRRAIALLESTEDTLHLARAHLLSSEILILDGQAEAAGSHLDVANRLFELGGDAHDKGAVRAQEAKREALLGRPEEALERARESLQLTGDAPLGSAYFALGLAHSLRGNIGDATAGFSEAVELLGQRGEWREAVQACRAWADMLREANRTEEAFKVLERAAELAEHASAAPRAIR
ncbi:MAG: helix-turn-helix domain-containing protein [Actinobacteria bacterium]|nr:MAG: helix-turn-helix domain-containing protein [Actinomycetota bacterium]